MPIHDWTAVRAGKFHHLHNSWIYKISARLNAGLLPPGFYAAGEQIAGEIEPDILALQSASEPDKDWQHGGAVVALSEQPPRVSTVMESSVAHYLHKQDRLAIRGPDGDHLVALIEIVSQGNKTSENEMERFLKKAASVLSQGVNLMVIDLFPPGSFDSQGLHGAIWEYLYGDCPEANTERPLTLAAYKAAPLITAYVEPTAVGETLVDMPLFLSQDWYVNVPLEETYQAAWKELPEPWRQELTAQE